MSNNFDPKLIEYTAQEDMYSENEEFLPYRRVKIDVYAVGGGTVGQYYANNHWGTRVTDDKTGKVLLESEEFYCGSHRNHAEVAAEILDFI